MKKPKKEVLAELKKEFKPEFLNRIDDIIVFHKLEQEDIRKIIDLMINKVKELMKKQGIEIEVTDSAKDLVAKQGFDQNYGARPLRRAIQSMIEDKVAEAILDGKVKDKAIVDCSEDKIVVRY